MAIKFGNSITLNGFQIMNFRVHVSNIAPSSPNGGSMWFDDINKALKYYNGTGWLSPITVSSAVTANNIPQWSGTSGMLSDGLSLQTTLRATGAATDTALATEKAIRDAIDSIAGVTSHSALTNLNADDHLQYYNQTRGDARYERLLGNPAVDGYVLVSTVAGVRSWVSFPTGGGMVYPSAGIAVSTGSSWGTSIVNNSTNWNTAYGWGNHAGLYRPVSWVPSWTDVTSKPSTFTPSAHQLDSITYHTVSGLTTGHFLKASSPTTFGFAALTDTEIKTLLTDWFVLEGTAPNQYIRCKYPFAGDYQIQAWSDTGWLPPTIWELMPVATSTTVGGIQLGSGSTLFLREDGTWAAPSGGGSMTYPAAGIALSTGSAWGTSITNNSANWNTAYGWGNHASAGYYVGTSSTIRGLFSSTATGLTYTSGTGVFSLTAGYGIPTTTQISNWNTAYGWGNHASVGYLTTISKAQVEAVLTGTITSHNHSGVYQPAHANLTSVAGLTYASASFVKMTAAGTFALDTNTYSLSSHNHSGTYQPAHTNLTSLAGLSYVSASFVKMTAAGTFTLDTNTYVTGSGSNTRIAYWSSTSNITSNSDFTYDGSILTIANGIRLTAPSSGTGSGTRTYLTAGESLAFGNVVYMKNDGKVWKANASSVTTAPVIGICMNSVAANGSADILLSGRVYNSSWSLGTGGDEIYLNTSAGTFSISPPSGVTGYVVQVLGVVLSSNTIYFNPSLTQIVLA